MVDDVTPIGGGLIAEGAPDAPDTPPPDPTPIDDLGTRLAAAEAAIAALPENSYARIAALETTVARLVELVTLHHTLLLRYHHQEVMAMLPPPVVEQPQYAPNALHIPN